MTNIFDVDRVKIPAIPDMRTYAAALVVDWYSGYITIETFAEHNGVSYEHALAMLTLCKAIAASPHPEGRKGEQ